MFERLQRQQAVTGALKISSMPKESNKLKGRVVRHAARPARTQRALERAAGRVREEFAQELYSRIRSALLEFGVTDAEQQRALERSRYAKTIPRASGRLMRDAWGLGTMLLEWSREAPYLDSNGRRRVLAIEGPGATFETLARQCLPRMPLDDVVAMACEIAEVTLRPQGKIALLGSILVKVVKSRERHLAHVIRHIDQLLATSLHNRRHQRRGRTERMTVGMISRANAQKFMLEVRPQVYDLMMKVDTSIRQHEPKTARALRSATAVGVGVYLSQEDDLERAGLELSLVSPLGRLRKQKPSKA